MQGRNRGKQSTRKEACLHEFLGTSTMSPKTRMYTKERSSEHVSVKYAATYLYINDVYVVRPNLP